ACVPSDVHGEADLTVNTCPNDSRRQLNWKDYFGHRKASDPTGTTYEFATNGVVLGLTVSINKFCQFDPVDLGRTYDVLRVTRRPVDE
ncbi:hypothetical protein AAVH_41407, partial [Aphelenchoides avenae]